MQQQQKSVPFNCEGVLTFATVEAVSRQCVAYMRSSEPVVVLNLRPVRQVDSAALALLIDILRTARQEQKSRRLREGP